MEGRDKFRIKHMIEATKECLTFVEEVKQEDFYLNRQMILAVIKEIEIIGEAASRISDETKSKYSLIPWKDIIDTRHRLVHGYFDINLDIVWRTLREDLPQLLLELEKISF